MRSVLPNEMRVSCGAELEVFTTVIVAQPCGWAISVDPRDDGRRQLHALVRLRTTSHSSGPSLSGSSRGTRRPRPRVGIVMPGGPLLRA